MMNRFFTNLVLTAVVFLLGLSSSSADGLKSRLKAEILLNKAKKASNLSTFETLYLSDNTSPEIRGKALTAMIAGVPPEDDAKEKEQTSPLVITEDKRLKLLKAFQDADAPVRAAAVRLVGEAGDKVLEKNVLKLAAEDPDPTVNVEALKAVRPWTRPSHLFFLDKASSSSYPQVQAEALISLTQLYYEETPPEIVEHVKLLADSSPSNLVKLRAMQTLAAWKRLPWEDLRAFIVISKTNEELWIDALKLCAGYPPIQRNELLLDVIEKNKTSRGVWTAYEIMKNASTAGNEFPEALADYLTASGKDNAMNRDIADFLSQKGYRAEYGASGWVIYSR